MKKWIFNTYIPGINHNCPVITNTKRNKPNKNNTFPTKGNVNEACNHVDVRKNKHVSHHTASAILFFCAVLSPIAAIYSFVNIYILPPHLTHATESTSSLADLYNSSLLAHCSLRSIKAGSSSNNCTSCLLCMQNRQI